MIRNRKGEYRTVRASELIPNPLNWRRHPPQQREVMQALLAEVGDIDVLKVVSTPDGLLLLDGHLRSDIMADQEVEVVVLDLDEAEQAKVLATFDPVSAMAQTDLDIYMELAQSVESDNETVNRLLEAVANGERQVLPDLPVGGGEDETAMISEQFHIMIECANEEEQVELLKRFSEDGYSCRAIIS